MCPEAATDVQKPGVSTPAATPAAATTPTLPNQQTPAAPTTPTTPTLIPVTDLNKLRSSLDKQVASIRKENEALKASLNAERQAREELQEAQELARMGDLSPEQLEGKKAVLAQAKVLRKQREELVEMEKRIGEKAKDVYAKEISMRTGIPVEQLMEYETPERMELEALKIENEQLKSKVPAANTPPKPGFDTGGGAGATAPIRNTLREAIDRAKGIRK